MGITSDYNIETSSYTLPFSSTPLPFSLFLTTPPSSPNLNLASIVEKPPGPLSHGYLRLSFLIEAKIAPRVRFNYFSHPTDLSRCVRTMRNIGEMLETKSMDWFKYKDYKGERGFIFLGPSLPANLSDDLAMEAFCRSLVTTYRHYHGGCVVGKVVDGDFRVMGINSLRVVDGSTFNMSPGTNPQSTLMMLGR